MKYFVCILLLFCSFSVFAQTPITDSLQNIPLDLAFLDSIKVPPIKIEREVEEKEQQFVFCSGDENPARFEGGMEKFYQLIEDNLQFPKGAKKGRVFVWFVVDTLGKMTNFEIKESPNEANSKEVLRVMNIISKNHHWTPATQRDKKVKVRIAMPIFFMRRSKKR